MNMITRRSLFAVLAGGAMPPAAEPRMTATVIIDGETLAQFTKHATAEAIAVMKAQFPKMMRDAQERFD